MAIRDSWTNFSLPDATPIALICPELITWTAGKFEQLMASEVRTRPTDYLNIEASRAVRYLVSSGWRGTAVVLGDGGELIAGALLGESEPRWVIVRIHDLQDTPNGMSANVTVECEPK